MAHTYLNHRCSHCEAFNASHQLPGWMGESRMCVEMPLQDLPVIKNIQPDCVGVVDLDTDNSMLLKVQVKHRKFWFSTWAESAEKPLRWHWGYLWLVNVHHCHVNAVGRLWWSSKRDYIWAGSTLNSHFIFRRHKEVWGLPNAMWEISAERAGLSALLLRRINM